MRPHRQTLFIKNHVSIVLHENEKPNYGDPIEIGEDKEPYYVNSYVLVKYTTSQITSYEDDLSRTERRCLNNKARKWVPKYEHIKKESPLGFYYTKMVCTNEEEQLMCCKQPKMITETKVIKEIIVKINNNKYYSIIYPVQHNEVSIKYNGSSTKYNVPSEIRPWQLFDGSWEDHFTTDLLNILNSIFDEAKNAELKEYEKDTTALGYHTIWKLSNRTYRDVQLIAYFELFGNQDGPKYQTNDEKILAAGFDLKTSFRKDKEA